MIKISDITIHATRNGVLLTVDTERRSYEYNYKDIPTAVRKIKHITLEIQSEEEIENASSN